MPAGQKQSAFTLIEGSADKTDAFFTLFQSGVNKKLGASDMLEFIGQKTITVNFATSMNAVDIQTLIDAILKYIPYGYLVTFQFADGSFTINSTLYWGGFFGGGGIKIYGNTTETDATVLHTTQQVILDFTGAAGDGLIVNDNSVSVDVFNLRVQVADTYKGLSFSSSIFPVRAYYNYFELAGVSAPGYGVYCWGGVQADIRQSYFTAGQYGIYALNNSTIHSNGNDDTGTQPTFGMRAQSNSTIGKTSTQITGSSSDEVTGGGGVIR